MIHVLPSSSPLTFHVVLWSKISRNLIDYRSHKGSFFESFGLSRSNQELLKGKRSQAWGSRLKHWDKSQGIHIYPFTYQPILLCAYKCVYIILNHRLFDNHNILSPNFRPVQGIVNMNQKLVYDSLTGHIQTKFTSPEPIELLIFWRPW